MRISRRRMLSLILGTGGLAAAGLAAFELRRGSNSFDGQFTTRQGWALGSDVTLTVQCDSVERAERALETAFAELDGIEQVMSLYRADSQICRLNQERELVDPHPDLVTVLRAASDMSRQSDGAFDITVQPMWDLYSKCGRSGQLPTPAQIELARSAIDWTCVEVDSHLVRLRSPVTGITLNGIAQGFAADRVIEVFRAYGIQNALINAGEVGSLGRKTPLEAWKAGVQDPRVTDAFAAIVPLDGRSLATSGDYQTSFVPDFSQNHIFDPHTGHSPLDLASVSILAPTGIQADALSTTAMVLGVDRSLSLFSRLPNVDALMILKSGASVSTPGFPSLNPA
jgi:thiamine biosynthesis lipoprotein